MAFSLRRERKVVFSPRREGHFELPGRLGLKSDNYLQHFPSWGSLLPRRQGPQGQSVRFLPYKSHPSGAPFWGLLALKNPSQFMGQEALRGAGA